MNLDFNSKVLPKAKFLCIFVGPSGCGKSTVMEQFYGHYNIIKTYTTRPKRTGDDDHIFITDDDLCKYKRKYALIRTLYGNTYFIDEVQLAFCNVVALSEEVALELKLFNPESVFLVRFTIPQQTRAYRMRLRGDSSIDVVDRCFADENLFNNISIELADLVITAKNEAVASGLIQKQFDNFIASYTDKIKSN